MLNKLVNPLHKPVKTPPPSPAPAPPAAPPAPITPITPPPPAMIPGIGNTPVSSGAGKGIAVAGVVGGVVVADDVVSTLDVVVD